MVSIRNFLSGAALALAAGGPALAAKPPPTTAPAVQAVVDCRRIEDSIQRLACYDAATDALTKAAASGDLVTLDRQQRRSVRKQAFGFTLPALAMFDAGEKAEDSIDETLASARQDAQGKWRGLASDRRRVPVPRPAPRLGHRHQPGDDRQLHAQRRQAAGRSGAPG
jgi:hypothetical protein